MSSHLAPPHPLHGWAQPTDAAGWTAEMLERLPDDGWLYELVEGRVVRMPPPGPHHGRYKSRIDRRLGAYVEEHNLGETYGETGWDLTRRGERKGTVLVSDVAVVRAERLPLPPPRRGKTYPPLAPDLVVEIASPGQTRAGLGDKARLWLERGVRMVWIAWPERGEIDIWSSGTAEPRTLRGDDELDADEVIPGFRIRINQIW